MATRTSVGSGLWSAAGTWDTGVPVDGDDVVIASGHIVTFDVDQSAFTTGVGITITGTLNHTTTTGSYTLFAKTGGSIVGAGTWNIGTSATPIPFAAKHTITGAAGWYVDGNAGLTMTVYGAEPTYTYIKLSGNEANGQTELSVDTDVTGDIWAAGDIITINDINKTQESEERVIAAGGIAADAITVTAGLTAAKSTGAYICLISRNVKIIAVGVGARTIYRVGKLTIGGGMWYGVGKIMFDACHYTTISGGAFTKSNSLSNSNYMSITGGVFTGQNYQLINGTDISISGGLFTGNSQTFLSTIRLQISGGIFVGNWQIFRDVIFCNITGGTIVYNETVVQKGSYVDITGATISDNVNLSVDTYQLNIVNLTLTGNTYDLYQVSNGKAYNTVFGSNTEFFRYQLQLSCINNFQSEDHDGEDGALKAWCKGGVVTSQTSVKPDGYTQAYLLYPESADYPVFFTKQFSVEPGKTVGVEVQLRKDASMTYLPRVYLMASIGNPLAGATPVDSFTMTDSTNTWESDTFTIANSTDYDQDYTLWFVAQNATGNAYSAYDITTQGGSGGGGAVSIQPLSGRLGL